MAAIHLPLATRCASPRGHIGQQGAVRHIAGEQPQLPAYGMKVVSRQFGAAVNVEDRGAVGAFLMCPLLMA